MDVDDWEAEVESIAQWYSGFDARTPARLIQQLELLDERLETARDSQLQAQGK